MQHITCSIIGSRTTLSQSAKCIIVITIPNHESHIRTADGWDTRISHWLVQMRAMCVSLSLHTPSPLLTWLIFYFHLASQEMRARNHSSAHFTSSARKLWGWFPLWSPSYQTLHGEDIEITFWLLSHITFQDFLSDFIPNSTFYPHWVYLVNCFKTFQFKENGIFI